MLRAARDGGQVPPAVGRYRYTAVTTYRSAYAAVNSPMETYCNTENGLRIPWMSRKPRRSIP